MEENLSGGICIHHEENSCKECGICVHQSENYNRDHKSMLKIRQSKCYRCEVCKRSVYCIACRNVFNGKRAVPKRIKAKEIKNH